MFHDETQPENHLERPTQLPVENTPEDADLQRKRMLIALGILLACAGCGGRQRLGLLVPATGRRPRSDRPWQEQDGASYGPRDYASASRLVS